MRLGKDKFQQTSLGRSPAKAGETRSGGDASDASRISLTLTRAMDGNHVPLFAAGLVLGATVAILVAVCRWPSQRLANGAGRSN